MRRHEIDPNEGAHAPSSISKPFQSAGSTQQKTKQH